LFNLNQATLDSEACIDSNTSFSKRLGHASDIFPLAAAQRDTLTHLLATGHGDILAVNGPPGTGKTTLLLSVVASLWAKAALEGGEPPIILAASTNNQAVTNIIDAFGKDFASGTGVFAGRWLPEVNSYGAYFPSKTKESEAATKYQTQNFFNGVESKEYFVDAEIAYLTSARIAFPNESEHLTAAFVVQQLSKLIHSEVGKLEHIEMAWKQFNRARTIVKTELGEQPDAALTRLQNLCNSIEENRTHLADILEQLVCYITNESIFLSIFFWLFSWLPPVVRKQKRLAEQFLKVWNVESLALDHWETAEQVESLLVMRIAVINKEWSAQQQRIQEANTLIEAEKLAVAQWHDALTILGLSDDQNVSLVDCDTRADTQIRFKIFQLTTHYWEGRWLMDMQDLLLGIDNEKKKTGSKSTVKRWQRRMKLTPCVVSTLFMLPAELTVKKFAEKGRYLDDYLYDFADLLIIDEAGQVLPEVAGASFALSKRALVIGDTYQIEPIWSIPRCVDIGNLIHAQVIVNIDVDCAYEQLSILGKTAASGSVMQIAQNACRYHYDPELARGMFLYEHRRCFDEIISYSNELCYHGKLKPKRGSWLKNGLPPMGYLHVNGLCEVNRGGSRQNVLEAETIASWVFLNQKELTERYQKPLHEIVAVVTPFSAQVVILLQMFKAHSLQAGKGTNEMTIGTVHSLQGAERPVIIFSSVYSKHEDGQFIDSSPSMLNVAVSRAMDSFLVFADMDVFTAAPKGTPRGLLATYLFRNRANELVFENKQRQDLIKKNSLSQLRDAQEHDTFFA
jgi:hypothetical protein